MSRPPMDDARLSTLGESVGLDLSPERRAVLAADENIPTVVVATLDDVIRYAEHRELRPEIREAIQTYRRAYGTS